MYRLAANLASKPRIDRNNAQQISSNLSWRRNYAAKDIKFGVDARALMLRGPKVGTISANGEREIGELIAKAMEKVGKEGVITISDGKTLYNELEVVEGMKLDRGYISPYFITNPKNQKCELDDPLVLIHEKKMSLNAIVKVLELAKKNQRSLLIVAEDIERKTLNDLIMYNFLARICKVKAQNKVLQVQILYDLLKKKRAIYSQIAKTEKLKSS